MPDSKPEASLYLASVTFTPTAGNAVTWDKTAGGPQGVNAEVGGRNLPFYSGDALWPVLNPVIENQGAITVELSEYVEVLTIGTKGKLAVTITKPDQSEIAVPPYNNMRFAGSTAGQSYGRYATRVLRFVYEADDGDTGPQD